MVGEIHSAFDSIEASDARCVVLAHAGPAFSAGHDLREIQAMQASGDYDGVAALFAQTASLVQRIPGMAIPVIAAVNGVAAAAGCQLALSADIVVATERSVFMTPGARVGLFCNTPGVALAAAAPPKIAAEMLLCGHGIPAGRAASVGMINYVVSTEGPLPGAADATVPEGVASPALTKAIELAQTIAIYDAGVIARGKQAMHRVDSTRGLEAKYTVASEAMVSAVHESACREGIAAFIEKRPPVWPAPRAEARNS